MRKLPVLAAATGIAVAALAAAGGAMMSVQVRNAQLRATPSFLGRPAADVPYGVQVTLLATNGAWRQVSAPGVAAPGWIHESALTPKKLVMTGGAGVEQTGASAGEVSLAAKGFTEQVERAYKAGNPDADFTWVDRMEKMKVTPEEAAVFLREGGLPAGEGGAR
jgi:hypothetical protein